MLLTLCTILAVVYIAIVFGYPEDDKVKKQCILFTLSFVIFFFYPSFWSKFAWLILTIVNYYALSRHLFLDWKEDALQIFKIIGINIGIINEE